MFLHRLLSAVKSSPTTTTLPPLFKPRFGSSSTKAKTSRKTKKKLKRLRQKLRRPLSARFKKVQTLENLIPHFESILHRDAHFRFLLKSKQFISKQPNQLLNLDHSEKIHQTLGFPRGRKIHRFINNHLLLFRYFRHDYDVIWVGFTNLMKKLLEEEVRIYDEMEADRVNLVRKLLMMSVDKRIALSKIYYNRMLFGIGEDIRERVRKYPDYFRVVDGGDRFGVLELVKWDPLLAVSALEREFMYDEEKVKRAFKWTLKGKKVLPLDENEEKGKRAFEWPLKDVRASHLGENEEKVKRAFKWRLKDKKVLPLDEIEEKVKRAFDWPLNNRRALHLDENEEKVKRVFKRPLNDRKVLPLDEEEENEDEDEDGKLATSNTLPLVSPYTDGSKFQFGTLESEKYRVGVIHEFLSLTVEKRAYIHNIVEFREDFCLTKDTYHMLKKQPQTFYLAGTEMNWCVFLKDAYGKDGSLIHKDPIVLFYEKLYKYADMKTLEPGDELSLE